MEVTEDEILQAFGNEDLSLDELCGAISRKRKARNEEPLILTPVSRQKVYSYIRNLLGAEDPRSIYLDLGIRNLSEAQYLTTKVRSIEVYKLNEKGKERRRQSVQKNPQYTS